MKKPVVRLILVFVLMLSVLERSGVSMIAFASSYMGKVVNAEWMSDDTDIEKEGLKDDSIKEFYPNYLSSSVPVPATSVKAEVWFVKNMKGNKLHHPSVPTPPPDLFA